MQTKCLFFFLGESMYVCMCVYENDREKKVKEVGDGYEKCVCICEKMCRGTKCAIKYYDNKNIKILLFAVIDPFTLCLYTHTFVIFLIR